MEYKFGYWKYNDGTNVRYTPFFDKMGNDYLDPLIDYFVMLEYYYINYKQGNNIANWLDLIERQIYLKDNQEYFGDNVCVFFDNDNVKIINYWDYEAGKDNYCELELIKLKQLTTEWKWFVIDWEIKMIKGEI